MDETTLRSIAAQLARPSGEGAETIAATMNEVNNAITARVIETLAPQTGEIIAENCRSAPLDATSLDGLMAVNLLYFIDDLADLFGQISNWLKPDGRAVFGIRSADSLNAMPFTQYGFRVRPLEEIETALRQSGFSNIASTYQDEGTTMFGELEIPVDSIVIAARTR